MTVKKTRRTPQQSRSSYKPKGHAYERGKEEVIRNRHPARRKEEVAGIRHRANKEEGVRPTGAPRGQQGQRLLQPWVCIATTPRRTHQA